LVESTVAAVVVVVAVVACIVELEELLHHLAYSLQLQKDRLLALYFD